MSARFHILLLAALLPLAAVAENTQRARMSYMLFCQGCHLPDGRGAPGAVPPMKDFVGNFLKVEGGRAFIASVPGVLNAPMDDERAAEVMNWMLREMSAAQLPEDFSPYTAAEMAAYRKAPLLAVKARRAELLGRMAEIGITE
ncbi:MAG: cytochrome c [Gammaproteobacteria bacterium]|nr:cytochrome c [Gammaproteobacteria bacterium]NNL99365.1 cytochrome c [Gammaproteobacteria bacterium]